MNNNQELRAKDISAKYGIPKIKCREVGIRNIRKTGIVV